MFSFNVTAILVGLGSLLLTLRTIPKLNGVIRFKKLMDKPLERSSHKMATPNLGGLAFYLSLMIAFYFISPFDKHNVTISLVPGLTIIFILGLKDDLVVLAPLSKLLGQLFAAAFLVFHFQFSIESLNGFLGIETINIYVAKILAIFIIIAVMNAINLIDGIDGLATSISLVIFSIFGYTFYYLDNDYLALLCITMIGSLLAFLYFNLNTNPKKKTFMGDTGSMILGFLIAALSVRLLALDKSSLALIKLNGENLPIVVIAILIVPFFDTGRVFFLRILNKKSPFKPDRNHIHHIIVDHLNISHRRASFCIGLVHFFAVLIFGFLAINSSQIELLFTFAGFILLAILFFFYLNNPDYLRWSRLRGKRYFKQVKTRLKKKEAKPHV